MPWSTPIECTMKEQMDGTDTGHCDVTHECTKDGT